jgi:hypothetical protein
MRSYSDVAAEDFYRLQLMRAKNATLDACVDHANGNDYVTRPAMRDEFPPGTFAKAILELPGDPRSRSQVAFGDVD